MNHPARLAVLGITAFAVLALGACSRKQPAPAPEPAPPMVNQDSINRVRDSVARADAARRAEQARQDSIANARRLAEQAQAEMRATLAQVVYFNFDDATLTDEGRATLEAKVPILVANPSLTIRVAGHTDERGSDEYNLALGQRRAVAVKNYLTTRGVSTNAIEAVSFGEEQPVASGSSEAAWAQNRRAEFAITSPNAPLARPRS